MFMSQETAQQDSRRDRRRVWILSSSLALHALALATVAAFQVWRVEAVAEPPVADVFQVLLPLPEQSATGDAGRKAANDSRQPAKPPTARQVPPLTQPAAQDLAAKVTPAPASPETPLADLPIAPSGPVTADDPSGGSDDRDGKGNGKGNGLTVLGGGDERVLPIGGAISRPQIVPGTRVQPVYTEAARKARLQGTVVLQATIDEGGNVIDVRVLKPLPLGLDREAVSAVSQWKFTPALLHGRPVKVFFSVTVQFETR